MTRFWFVQWFAVLAFVGCANVERPSQSLQQGIDAAVWNQPEMTQFKKASAEVKREFDEETGEPISYGRIAYAEDMYFAKRCFAYFENVSQAFSERGVRWEHADHFSYWWQLIDGQIFVQFVISDGRWANSPTIAPPAGISLEKWRELDLLHFECLFDQKSTEQIAGRAMLYRIK